jgi:transcriptional regulator with XRE-family HTH domain
MQLNIAVGQTIKELREGRGMTLRNLSDKSYVSFNYLCEIEQGKKWASPSYLEGIARGLSLTPADLIKEVYEYLAEEH